MKAIVEMDKNWAIGKGNDLLVRIPMDREVFSAGDQRPRSGDGQEKTLESFSGRAPAEKQNEYRADQKRKL